MLESFLQTRTVEVVNARLNNLRTFLLNFGGALRARTHDRDVPMFLRIGALVTRDDEVALVRQRLRLRTIRDARPPLCRALLV